MDSRTLVARTLAAAFVAGDVEVDQLIERGNRLLGRRWRWLRPLAQRVAETFGGQTRPRRAMVARFILVDAGFFRACQKHDLHVADLLADRPTMSPVSAAKGWDIPAIQTAGELAAWLDVTIGELDWFADLRSFEGKHNESRLRHYHYRPLTKRFGHIRLIEAPKPRLKAIQRRILTAILEQIPPHDAAHGFRRGRSIRTFALPHVGQQVVVKMDLQDFFPSISVSRVRSLFRTAGYPEDVADLLAGLCTNSTPPDIWEREVLQTSRSIRAAAQRYLQPHLPQGASTSPALANLCAYRMDCRLSGLAQAAGAVYTRYADDLAFSGEDHFARIAERFHLHVCATVIEEGFTIHHRKTRIMRTGVCQRLAGIVVNQRLNVIRRDFDRLRATLANCVRFSPQTQNREGHQDYRGHLAGRIAFVEMINPARGRRLRGLFDQINWDGSPESREGGSRSSAQPEL